MEIKPFSPADMPACVDAFMVAYNKMPWNYNWSRENASKYLTEYSRCPNFVGYVLWDGGAIQGGVFAHTRTWWTNDQLFIDELFVGGSSQGKGYGKALMQYAEIYCLEHDLEMITLMTNKLMPAMKFYENLDFVKVDQFIFMFKQVEEED